jgi:neutral trehalase
MTSPSCSNDEAPAPPTLSEYETRAAAALAALCVDFEELERLAHLLKTFPASYGLSGGLVASLGRVGSRLWDIHDDEVK